MMMTQRSHVFFDDLVQHEKFANWEAFVSPEHEQRQLQRNPTKHENWNAHNVDGSLRLRAHSISEELCSCLFDRHENIFNNEIFDWDEFEDTETQVNTTPRVSASPVTVASASSMMHLTPVTTTHRANVKREAEPALFDVDFNLFDFEFLEEATVALTPPAPRRETAKCKPLVKQTKKHKATRRAPSRSRKRPFKNVRERERRARINNKLTELCDLCSSDAVTSIVPRPSAAMKELTSPSEGSGDEREGSPKSCSKMDILRDSFHIIEEMDKELIRLRARNKELKMRNLK